MVKKKDFITSKKKTQDEEKVGVSSSLQSRDAFIHE